MLTVQYYIELQTIEFLCVIREVNIYKTEADERKTEVQWTTEYPGSRERRHNEGSTLVSLCAELNQHRLDHILCVIRNT